MANEVVIKVKADNDTRSGFAAARKSADDFGKDLVSIGKKAGSELAQLGPKMGSSLADGLTKSFGPVGGKIVALLGAGAAAAAPVLGAAVSAAIVGGAAGTGVIGGLVLVSKDPRVKAAGIALGDEVMKGLEEKSKVFVGPALQGIGRLRAGFREIGPDLDKIFRSSAKYVDPLVDGLVSGGKKAIGGIATAISRAGPIIETFGESFDKIGGAVGDMFETISEDTESAAEGFEDVTDAIVLTIGATGELLSALTKTYGWFRDTTALDEFIEWLGKGKDANEDLADSHDDAAGAADRQTSSLKQLADELRAQTDPVFALLEAETELGEARTKYNKAVEKYGKNSAEARDELNKMAIASIDLQGAVGELGAEFDGKVSPALRRTLTTAGWTTSEIDALEKQFRDTKRAGDAFAKTYRAKVVTEYINVYTNKVMSAAEKAYNDTKAGRASGGTIGGAASGRTMGRDLTWVGEQGPELVELPVGSTVRSSGDSMRMMAQGQRAAGMGGHGNKMTLRADVDPTLDRTLVGLLMRALRLEIGSASGDVQTELGRN